MIVDRRLRGLVDADEDAGEPLALGVGANHNGPAGEFQLLLGQGDRDIDVETVSGAARTSCR